MSERGTRGERVPYVDRGEPLPATYGENRIVGLVRDPEHLFIYWDLSAEVRLGGNPLLVRVHCLTEGTSHDIEPGAETHNWHLQVASNRTYRLQIYERQEGGLMLLAASGEVTTPVRWAAEAAAEAPAEIFHAERHPLAREGSPARFVDARRPGPRAPAPPKPVTAPSPTLHRRSFDYTHGPGGDHV